MAIDFSWLINALQNIANNIWNFFNSLWGATQQIINTGQGIFTGLVNFGAWLYQGLVDAFNWLYNGIKWIGDQLYNAWQYLGNAIQSAWNFIASNLFAVGQWLWAGIQGLANMIVNGVLYLANAVYNFFVNTWNAIFTYIANFKLAVDNWWSGLIAGIRNKIKASVMFSVTTHLAWQSMERIPKASSFRDILFGLSGILISPIPAVIMGEMLDVMLPTPSTIPQKVAPDLTGLGLTAPTIELIAPIPPTPSAPTALAVGVGAIGEFISVTMTSKDLLALTTPTGEFSGFPEGEQAQDITVTADITTETIP